MSNSEEDNRLGVIQRRDRHGDAVDHRLEAGRSGDDAPLLLVERRGTREERRRVAVGAEPEEDEPEPHASKLAFVRFGCLDRRKFSENSMNVGRRHGEPDEQAFASKPKVGAGILGRNTTLVSPPERGVPPIAVFVRGQLIGAARRRASGERDVEPVARSLDEQRGRSRGCLLAVVDDDQLNAHKALFRKRGERFTFRL